MKFQQRLTLLITSITLILPFEVADHSYAATFTSSEINEIKQVQNKYAALPKLPYTSANLYAVPPHLTAPFSVGQVTDSYISSTLAYINFYRQLFALPTISSNNADNSNAQIAASVMAAINANPFHNQHGLPNEKQPSYINDMDWNLAKTTTASSNLNFNASNESAGDVVTDLLTDRFNLDGSDTGHRAWLLSTRATTTGIGAAYGGNGYRYTVQQVVYPGDTFNAPAKSSVTYPSSGIFPIELVQGSNIAWSVYLSDQTVNGTPSIKITDLDTGQTSYGTNVKNYSSQGFGNFATILTYYPGNINLVSGHAYSVQIDGVTSYTFKLFNEVASNQPTLNQATNKQAATNDSPMTSTDVTTNQSDTPQEADIKIKSALLLKAQKLADSLNKGRIYNPLNFGRSYQNGKRYFNLGSNQWFHNFYLVNNPEIEAGIINISDTALDTNIYTSPYHDLQKVSTTHVSRGKSYAYGQTIKIGKTRWFYLGPNQWIQQPASRKLNLKS
ncbi:CAP domain-containing protein [Lactobacillus sp. PV034]|uniref:CAP domain-containing protein n=1 Tax=Lactobacillus sp. PV034 TaxID=2594495 RepID=UPI002240AEFE|nr:CAP domain-containing protein [Lactobacillus sp. PV034]QNQ81042.1 CAP domain-containing protein [Lactobacillus sp. PV034]